MKNQEENKREDKIDSLSNDIDDLVINDSDDQNEMQRNRRKRRKAPLSEEEENDE